MTDAAPPSPVSDTAAAPPKKWLGRKGGWIILGGFAVFWLYLLIFETFVEHSRELVPTVLVLGGFALASALIYTMAYRLHPADGITVTRLLLAFLLGGLISTTIAGSVNWAINTAGGGLPTHPTLLALSLAGVVEEFCKIVAVVIMSARLGTKSARNGLFIGGAVGLGFSAIEDMGYQARAWNLAPYAHDHLTSIIAVTVERDIIGPLEHPVMTALFAAALFAASRNGRFRITVGVVGTYLAVALVHGLIDSSPGYLELLLGPTFGAAALGIAVMAVLALGSGIVWLVVSRRLRAGQNPMLMEASR